MDSLEAVIPVLAGLTIAPETATSLSPVTISVEVSEKTATLYRLAVRSGTIYAGEEAVLYE